MYPGAARTRDPLILVVGNIWIIIQLVLDVEASSRASEKPSSEYDGPAIPNHDLAQGPRLTSGLGSKTEVAALRRDVCFAPAIGRPGPLEGVTLRRDRATAVIEEICCAKIRGCSCREDGASYPMSAMPPQRPRSAAQRNDAMCQSTKSLRSSPLRGGKSREAVSQLRGQRWRV